MLAPPIYTDESLLQDLNNKKRDPLNPQTEYHKWSRKNTKITRESIINYLNSSGDLVVENKVWNIGENDDYEEKQIVHEAPEEGQDEQPYVSIEDKFNEIEKLNWNDNSDGGNVIPSGDTTLIKKYLADLSEHLHEPLMDLIEYRSTQDKINYRYHITAKGYDFYNCVLQEPSFAQYIFYGEMCPLYDMLNRD